jgi:exonuclease SbcC
VGKIEDKKKLEQEIEKTKIIISSKSDAIFNNKKTISQLSEEIKSLEHLRVEDSLVPKLEGEVKIFKIQREEMREKNVQITSKISSLSLKNNENESLKGKLSKMELCPTCLQDVNAVHKSNVANQLDSNTSENVKKIESLTMEKRELSEKLNKIEFELSQKEKQIQELRILKVKFQNLQEKQNLILDIEKTNLSLEKDISILREHMELLKDSIFDLKKFENVFIEKQKEFANASKEERISEIKVAELKKEIGFFSNQIKELSEKILKIEQIKLQLNYISSLENWLTKNFISLITNIEKNVMIKLKSEFSKLFSEWFSMLVSDIFNIRLDDDFTPIIEQQDYEIDYAYLSGGERTAVALAYRLALNQVINSLMSKIKTRDLVILDEPTDGFSETQLDKMRDVLQQLNVKQLIIVSHEQKIEGFVENVIRFKKEGGVSQRE